MLALFAFQLAVPLILIAWLSGAPAQSLMGFWVQGLAAVAGLLALGLTGVWLLPPWWAPYGFAGLLLVAILAGLRRGQPFASRLPSSVGACAAMTLSLAPGAAAVSQASGGLAGRQPPPARMVNLLFPLAGGTYLIVNGGSDVSVNAHMKTLDTSVPRFRAWRGQSYGIDIVGIDALGLRTKGVLPADPAAYRIHDASVLAPCAGEIIVIHDGLPDMPVPMTDTAHRAGNHLILRCGDVEVVLGHLRPGSFRVAVGASVSAGSRLAAVGNSGASDEPHLHVHAQLPGADDGPLSGDPLPIRFDGRFLVRNDHVVVPGARS